MSNPSVRAGVTFGVIIAVLGIISTILGVVLTQNLGPAPTPGDAAAAQQYLQHAAPVLLLVGGAGLVLFVIDIGVFLLAGRAAAKQTGTVGSGAIAGLIAGLLGAILSSIVRLILNAAGVATSPSSTGTALSGSALLALAIGGAILGILIDGGIGAGVGALGGLIGKNAYDKTHAQAPIGMPGAYPPGAYPPPPGYPPQPMQ